MGMFHPTSGKRAFRYYHKDTPIVFSREVALELVRIETILRNSKYYQDMYSEKDDLDHFEAVTVLIQKRVLRESGIPDDVDNMNAFLNLRAEYCNESEFKDVSVYFKYDRTFIGNLEERKNYPDCDLVTLSGERTQFSKFVSPEIPTFVLAGSYS